MFGQQRRRYGYVRGNYLAYSGRYVHHFRNDNLGRSFNFITVDERPACGSERWQYHERRYDYPFRWRPHYGFKQPSAYRSKWRGTRLYECLKRRHWLYDGFRLELSAHRNNYVLSTAFLQC